jgi:hypothetical protein
VRNASVYATRKSSNDLSPLELDERRHVELAALVHQAECGESCLDGIGRLEPVIDGRQGYDRRRCWCCRLGHLSEVA